MHNRDDKGWVNGTYCTITLNELSVSYEIWDIVTVNIWKYSKCKLKSVRMKGGISEGTIKQYQIGLTIKLVSIVPQSTIHIFIQSVEYP